MAVKAIPQGFHSITPYLHVNDGAKAIAFYKQAFGALEVYRLDMPDGSVGHAELTIGNSHIMLADQTRDGGLRSPTDLDGTSVAIHLYVEDVDGMYAQAMAAGAVSDMPVTDMFYGDRTGSLKDPFGHLWFIGTHKEDLTPQEIAERMKAQFG